MPTGCASVLFERTLIHTGNDTLLFSNAMMSETNKDGPRKFSSAFIFRLLKRIFILEIISEKWQRLPRIRNVANSIENASQREEKKRQKSM